MLRAPASGIGFSGRTPAPRSLHASGPPKNPPRRAVNCASETSIVSSDRWATALQNPHFTLSDNVRKLLKLQ